MEDTLIGLAMILGLVFLFLPVGVIYLLVSNAKLKERISSLETRVKRLQSAQDKPATQTAEAPKTPQVATSSVASDPEITKAVSAPQDQALATAPEAKTPETTWVPPERARQAAQRPNIHTPSEPTTPRTDLPARFGRWLVQNWFYVVSAVSLALAGIYFVIYSMEQGLLPPIVRVLLTFGFGGSLLAAGEFLRRRFGDEDDKASAYLPSTFSGAGIVTLFAGVLLARFLYGFIGPEVALVGLALIGAVAMIFGWFYGPFLAAVGILGAMAAPFIIGGSSDGPEFLLLYFAVIAITGLLIDTLRRWAWVSVLSLVCAFVAGALLMFALHWTALPALILYAMVLAAAAIIIPVRRLWPDHTGLSVSAALLMPQDKRIWPSFPVCLAAGTVFTASALIFVTAFDVVQDPVFWSAIAVLTVMVLALLLWTRKTEALVDLAALPFVALLATVGQGVFTWGETWGQKWGETAQADLELGERAALPLDASLLIGVSLLISAAAFWRSLKGGALQLPLAAAAVLCAPLMAITLEVAWQPASVLGSFAWALHALVIGAVMVFFAERFAKVDGPEHRARMSLAVLCALTSITFALVLIFSLTALTAGIVFAIVTAMWLDRQYNLPWMSAFVLPGVMAVGYRLTLDPGIDWAMDAPWWEMLMVHGGAVLGLAGAWVLAKQAGRPRAQVLIESAVVSAFGIFITYVLGKGIMELAGGLDEFARLMVGLTASVWILLGLVQLRRLSLGGRLQILRKVLAGLFIGAGTLQLLSSVTVMNPAVNDWFGDVVGPALVNTLIPSYLLPAAVYGFGAWWLKDTPKSLRHALMCASAVLATVWLVLTIRHVWQGAEGMDAPIVAAGELYSYTVALMVIGAGLIYQSIARSSAFLRKAGLAVIALAVVKVFAWDIRDLGGLIRVFSLLFLGLALAGLAWLNRWAAARAAGSQGEITVQEETSE